MNETPYSSWDEAVSELYEFVRCKVEDSDEDYILCGNSMGAYLVYSVRKMIDSLGFKKPAHLFFIAANPNVSPDVLSLDVLEENNAKLFALRESKYYKVCIAPMIMNDFKILKMSDNMFTAPIDNDFTVMYGSGDNIIKKSDSFNWGNIALGEYKVLNFDGDHLFLLTNESAAVSIISETGI